MWNGNCWHQSLTSTCSGPVIGSPLDPQRARHAPTRRSSSTSGSPGHWSVRLPGDSRTWARCRRSARRACSRRRCTAWSGSWGRPRAPAGRGWRSCAPACAGRRPWSASCRRGSWNVFTIPLFSATKTRPFAAISMSMGSVRPEIAVVCSKPGGSVTADAGFALGIRATSATSATRASRTRRRAVARGDCPERVGSMALLAFE